MVHEAPPSVARVGGGLLRKLASLRFRAIGELHFSMLANRERFSAFSKTKQHSGVRLFETKGKVLLVLTQL